VEAPIIESLDHVPVNFISLCVLGALLLRRLVRMDGHHRARVVILTGLLWVPAVYLLLLPYAPAHDHTDCVPGGEEPRAFCISE
jgi:hypothetical protein